MFCWKRWGRLKVLLLVCCVGVGLLAPAPIAVAADAPAVSAANGAILITADTGTVLYEKDADKISAMASTTKIMSTLLALESGDLDTQFEVDPNAIQVEGSSMGLTPGDKVTMRDLCYGMMLPSGNDAANAAAVRAAGSVDAFVQRMNEKAKELGMGNTVFATPSGLDDHLEHHSTARDMATLARAAMQRKDFREIASAGEKQLCFGNPPYNRSLYNHNRLLRMYGGCVGIKTGFTDKAGRCLVSAAERDGVTLIAVVLHAPNDWADSQALFDYGFSQVHLQSLPKDFSDVQLPVVGGDALHVGVCAGDPPQIAMADGMEKKIKVTVHTDPLYYAPLSRGEQVGTAAYTFDGEAVGEVPLYADVDVKLSARASLPVSFADRLHGMLAGFAALACLCR